MPKYNAFRPAETEKLIEALRSGASISDAAALLGRSFDCIQRHRRALIKQGRLEDRECECPPSRANLVVQLIRYGASDEEIAAITGETLLAIAARRCRVERSREYPKKVASLSNDLHQVKRVSSRVENGVTIHIWRAA